MVLDSAFWTCRNLTFEALTVLSSFIKFLLLFRVIEDRLMKQQRTMQCMIYVKV